MGVFVDCGLDARGKERRRWRISDAEKMGLCGLLGRPLPDGLGWTDVQATEQVEDLLDQVWWLYQAGRCQVEPAEVWQEMSLAVLEILDRQARGIRTFDQAQGLPAYVVACVRRKMGGLVGGGPALPKTKATSTADQALRRMSAAPVAFSQENAEVLSGQVTDDYLEAIGLSAHASAVDVLIAWEVRASAEGLREALRRLVPILAARFDGLAVQDYWEARDAVRRQYFLDRWKRTGEPIPWIAAEPGRRKAQLLAWQQATGLSREERSRRKDAVKRILSLTSGKGTEGRKARIRALNAGLAMWRAAGHKPFCLARQEVLRNIVAAWQGPALGNPEVHQRLWAAKIASACQAEAGSCTRCAGYGK